MKDKARKDEEMRQLNWWARWYRLQDYNEIDSMRMAMEMMHETKVKESKAKKIVKPRAITKAKTRPKKKRMEIRPSCIPMPKPQISRMPVPKSRPPPPSKSRPPLHKSRPPPTTKSAASITAEQRVQGLCPKLAACPMRRPAAR